MPEPINFSDTKSERKFLRERVFPQLKSFSRSLGLQFHVVDLYHSLPASWLCHETKGDSKEGEEDEEGNGSGGEGAEDNNHGLVADRGGKGVVMCGLELRGVLQLALREIRTCQNTSAGPTFIVGFR